MQQTFDIEIDNNEYLRKMAYKGLEKKQLSGQEYIDRLEMELDIITDANLSDFFLNTSYIIKKLQSKGIRTGTSRGSAGGSLVCYCLGITDINPLKYDLLFSRFINKTRIKGSLPDIDTDIAKDRRQEALELVKDEFGRDKTFNVPNLIMFTTKTAIKDISRVYNIPFQKVNKITKLIPDDATEEDLEEIPQLQAFFEDYPQVASSYKNIVGLIKAYGIHAGAEILLPKSIENYASTIRLKKTDCIAYNGRQCEELKMLKNDMLGLNTLTIIQQTLELIKEDIELPNEYEDSKVYETIVKAPLNIFQIETPAATAYTRKMKPDCFDDLVATLALIRPGAQNSGDADNYIDCKFGKKEVHYDDERLKPILQDTYGSIVYQEQAMKISMVLAGFTEVEADTLRKGISKKKSYIFDEYQPKFIDGCIENGVEKETAELIWEKIEASSEYSFNKSHSVGYAVTSYYTAWLKTYYPIEFSIACLNNTNNDEKKNKILTELQNINIEVKNPDINLSTEETRVVNNKIYMGFSTIDKVGDKAIESLLKTRNENQQFFSFEQFLENREPRKVNKGVVNSLIYAGAFDSFGERVDLYNYFNNTNEEWTEKEKLQKEYSVLKFSHNEKLLKSYTTDYDDYIVDLDTLDKNIDEEQLYLKGICADVDIKQGYAILHIQQDGHNVSVSVGGNVLAKYGEYLETGRVLLISCHLWKEKFYAHFIIDLDIEESYFSNEYDYIDNVSVDIVSSYNQEKNIDYNGMILVDSASYFKSKNGNDCLRIEGRVNRTKRITLINCMKPIKGVVSSDLLMYHKDNAEKPFCTLRRCK